MVILSFNEQFDDLAQGMRKRDLYEVCRLAFFDSLHNICCIFCISAVQLVTLLLVFPHELVFSDVGFIMSTWSSLLRNICWRALWTIVLTVCSVDKPDPALASPLRLLLPFSYGIMFYSFVLLGFPGKSLEVGNWYHNSSSATLDAKGTKWIYDTLP